MSCDGNCGKSSTEQDSDTWDAFIGRAAQGVIGYSDVYSGLGGGLGDWDGAGLVASGLFGHKKKKAKTSGTTWAMVTCIANHTGPDGIVLTDVAECDSATTHCCPTVVNGKPKAQCLPYSQSCPDDDDGDSSPGGDLSPGNSQTV